LAEKYTNEIKQLNEQIAKLKQDVAAKDAEISNQKNQAELARKEAAESLTVSQGATREIAKLQQERNQLADLLAKTKDDLAKVTKDLADMSAKETYARLRADALEKDYVALKEDHAALRRKYEQAQAELVRNGVRSRGAQENPPRLPTVETTGRVTEVSGQFASVSLGSDNGIEKGHILQVYRLGRGINDALYLGTLTITNVRPHEAVGVFEPSARGRTVSVNDTVDTKISH
jgi:hypothetical protein